MGHSVFVSMPGPFNDAQTVFAAALDGELKNHGLTPRTLGVTDWDPDAPLTAIRRLMLESNGLISVAFRRSFIESGESKPGTESVVDLGGNWLTSPWPHIEVAMAFQIGLPILILREAGVIDDGVLERGVSGMYLPQFDLEGDDAEGYFQRPEFQQLVARWVGYVQAVVTAKGEPPRMY